MAQVIITDFALKELQNIYDYISDKASENIAISVIDNIVQQIQLLEITPKIGRITEELKALNLGHRHFIVGHYKVIYRISGTEIVYITDIFDCRQHPKKIERRNI